MNARIRAMVLVIVCKRESSGSRSFFLLVLEGKTFINCVLWGLSVIVFGRD